MSDYSKMKNAELEALLKQRNLPHTGKKADMVARLQEADKSQKSTTDTPATSATATAADAEDEIDWDDDTTTDAAGKPAASTATTEPAAAAIAAGGQGQVDNPQAVPNQVTDTDPSKTDDLSVKAPEGEITGDAEIADGGDVAAAPVEQPKKDFSSGLKETTLDEELEKRKARAKKFGITEDQTDDAEKLLERAKKFGATGGPKGLNEALPERRERKRGREASDEGGRGNFKRRGRGGSGRGGRRGGERNQRGNTRETKGSNASGTSSWLSESDKAKAEARKARFAAAPTS